MHFIGDEHITRQYISDFWFQDNVNFFFNKMINIGKNYFLHIKPIISDIWCASEIWSTGLFLASKSL